MTSATQQFSRYLTEKRLKVTSERLAIARSVVDTAGHFDVDSLLLALRGRQVPVSRATLYRTLTHLLEAGLVRRVRRHDGTSRYESMAGRSHHDHMICLGCDAILEFADAKIEELQEAACRREGFTMTDHSLRIEGYCHDCAAKRSA